MRHDWPNEKTAASGPSHSATTSCQELSVTATLATKGIKPLLLSNSTLQTIWSPQAHGSAVTLTSKRSTLFSLSPSQPPFSPDSRPSASDWRSTRHMPMSLLQRSGRGMMILPSNLVNSKGKILLMSKGYSKGAGYQRPGQMSTRMNDLG